MPVLGQRAVGARGGHLEDVLGARPSRRSRRASRRASRLSSAQASSSTPSSESTTTRSTRRLPAGVTSISSRSRSLRADERFQQSAQPLALGGAHPGDSSAACAVVGIVACQVKGYPVRRGVAVRLPARPRVRSPPVITSGQKLSDTRLKEQRAPHGDDAQECAHRHGSLRPGPRVLTGCGDGAGRRRAAPGGADAAAAALRAGTALRAAAARDSARAAGPLRPVAAAHPVTAARARAAAAPRVRGAPGGPRRGPAERPPTAPPRLRAPPASAAAAHRPCRRPLRRAGALADAERELADGRGRRPAGRRTAELARLLASVAAAGAAHAYLLTELAKETPA